MPGRVIVDIAREAEPFARLSERLVEERARVWIGGLMGSAKSLLAAVLRRRLPRTWVVIAPTVQDAEHVYDDLVTFLGAGELQLFGEWETLPYERRSPLSSITESRLVTLSRLAAGESLVVVTTPKAIMQRTLSRRLLAEATQHVTRGGTLELTEFARSLVDSGYRRVRMVAETGDMSVRGGIVDILPFGYENPIRLELEGDRVESIREFDVYTQRSLRGLDEVSVLPRREVVLVGEGSGELAERVKRANPADSEDKEHLLNGLDTSFYFDGVEQYLPAIHGDAETLVDYLPDAAGVCIIRDEEVWDRADQLSLEAAKIYTDKREDMPLCDPESLLVPFERIPDRGDRPREERGGLRVRALGDHIDAPGIDRAQPRHPAREAEGALAVAPRLRDV